MNKLLIALFFVASPLFPAIPLIQAMKADSWMSAANTKIRPLCPSEASCAGITVTEGCGAVVWSWSGGVFSSHPAAMYDVRGRVVAETGILRGLPNGIYLVRENFDGKTFIRSIVAAR